jgi:Uroporphyrinogen-III decarboxylase
MPEEIRKLNIMDFYRHIGCNILQFGNYGLTKAESVVYPFRLQVPDDIVYEEYTDEHGFDINKRKTRWGELVEIKKQGHPVKYPVQTIEDIRILKNIWLNSIIAIVEDGCSESYTRIDKLLGEDGIFIPTSEPSSIQTLLENEIGVENFYYLLYDYQEEMEELLDIMNNIKKQEYKILAERTPYSAVIPVENTSTSYMSPQIYRKYCVPLMHEYADIMHRNGKKAIIHMCGLINELLPDIKEIGLDGIHALTPPPVGNTDYNHALDVLGDKLIILGCLDSTVFQSPYATSDDIKALLDKTVTPRLRESNYILWAVADGLPTPIEKFLVIREWMEHNAIHP